jgi:pimeloyl-ACP methyl ester carboxylesterase
VVANAFQEVSELVSSPARLLQPEVAARVLAGNVHKTVQQEAPLQRSLRIPKEADAHSDAVIVRGIRSPLIDLGARSDEAAVFVHGNPGSRLDWLDLAARVSEFGRAVAFDMPGFGQAEKPRQFDYHLASYVRHLEGVLAHLGIRRCHLVLHDFGGLWGLAWAARHPQAIRSVTLINTGIPWSYSWHLLARLWRTPLLGELFMASTTRMSFRALVQFRQPQKLPIAFIDQMYQHLDQETRRVILEVYRRTTDLESLARWLHQALRPLDLPTLVIWGQRDPYLPASLAKRQKETFPRAQVHGLLNGGHWPFIDAPSVVAEKLVGFLRFHLSPYESEAEKEVPQSIGV